MRITQWLVLAGTLTTLGCIGPWVTESGDVPVMGDAPSQIEARHPDGNKLNATAPDAAPIRPFQGRGKARKMAR